MANASSHSDIRGFLFSSNPIPMFLYDGGSLRIHEANAAALVRYGYTSEEFCSMTVRELRPCDDPVELETAPRGDLKTPPRLLRTHITKAGTTFAAEVQVMPFGRGRRRLYLMSAAAAPASTDANLIRSEQFHRSLVEECPFGIYRLNSTTMRFEKANPVLLRHLGYSLEELCSIDVLGLYLEDGDRDRFLSELHTMGSIHDFETCFRKKDGGILRASISAYLGTDIETSQQYIQGYVWDVTGQREREEQLNHSLRMEAVGRLAGGVAHDFNNITQSISLSCELALFARRTNRIEFRLVDIMEQAARAAGITRQLLAFSCGQLLQPCVVNLNDCIRRTLSKLTRTVGDDVSIDLQLDETVDAIFVDPDQLAEVLMYLASYARAAMPQGGQLRISTSGCDCNSGPKSMHSERYVVLSVADTGFGMDKRTLQRIFEPFFSTRDTTLASGLGLSTVHGIIAQSNGSIECESSPGEGATFRIYLPVAVSQAVGCEMIAS